MNKRQYVIYQDGRRHALTGGGLSGCPYADTDGDAWRSGVRSVLDAQDGAQDAQDGERGQTHG